jgi:hypothetical protein
MKAVSILIAEVVGSIFVLLIAWTAVGRLISSPSDLNVVMGLLLLLLMICFCVWLGRTVYFQAKEIIKNDPKNH